MANPYIGTWHIYKMELWEDDYFNMDVQAFLKINDDYLGQFHFGLVVGDIDGEIIDYADGERFVFTWDGVDELDPVNGSGWVRQVGKGLLEGEIKFHLGDRSKFWARKAERSAN